MKRPSQPAEQHSKAVYHLVFIENTQIHSALQQPPPKSAINVGTPHPALP